LFRVVAAAILASALALSPVRADGEPGPESPFEARVAAAKSVMVGDPAAALERAREAEAVAPAGDEVAVATAKWLQAEALYRMNRTRESLPVVDDALSAVAGAAGAQKLRGDLLLTRGRGARATGDMAVALSAFQDAYELFAEVDARRSEAIALQSIGSIYTLAHAFDRTLDYYERAAEIYSGDPSLDMVSFNNRANALKALGRYEAALALHRRALALAETFDSALVDARILTNMAAVHVEAGDLDAAEADANRALALVDDPGAAGWAPFVWGVKAQIAERRGAVDKARDYLERTFDGVDVETTTMPYRDFHEVASRVLAEAGEPAAALAHMRAFKRLDDEGRDAAASANLALVAAEFDFAAQELEIERLKIGQLERDIALATARARQRRLIYGAATMVGICLFLAVLYAWLSARSSGRRIAAINDQLTDANEELRAANLAMEEASQAKMEFLATTSHELRTPLNAIIGLTGVLLKERASQEEHFSYLRIVRTAGENLLEIVNDILDISRIEAGRLEVHKAAVDTFEVARTVGGLWRASAEKKGLLFTIDAPEGPGTYHTDERLLRQTLSNLLSNAVKFTEEGAVALRVRVDEGGESPMLTIEVSDTGPGVPEEKQDVIFESFKQADGALNRKHGGTGLGLAISQRIARALGGDVTLRSVPGEGATFAAILPAEPVPDAVVPEASAQENCDSQAEAPCEKALADLRVLIAEDNELNALVAKALLQPLVAEIVVVEDGEAAVRAVQERDFDLVLMDKQMPVMDGLEATREIRALTGPVSRIPIIAVTADAFEGSREIVMEAGMDGFIAKPINAPAIIAAIRDCPRIRLRPEDAGDDGQALAS